MSFNTMGEPFYNEFVYFVLTASAKMPSSCWGRYGRVAVVEVKGSDCKLNWKPKMISERAKGVNRIVETWEKCFHGKTERCAFRKAVKEATELACRLNVEQIRKRGRKQQRQAA